MRTALPILMAILMLTPTPSGALPEGEDDTRQRIAPDLVVVEATFGYVDPATGKIVEASRIDTKKHKGFGWRIRLEGTRRTVRFREQFVLPAPARSWQVGHETTVAPDRASAVTQGDRRLGGDMELRNAWMHTPGDPKGPHTIRVWIDGVLVKEFDFVMH